ncbi:MAG: amino acid aminotransferase [Steroidobacteraceae bacterium]
MQIAAACLTLTIRIDLMFEHLSSCPPDPILRLIDLHRRDERPGKIDLGVGVYRSETGATPVMEAVRLAQQALLAREQTKAYLGTEGNAAFLECLRAVIFDADAPQERIVGIQTPGGSGALRLAGELATRARPGAAIWVGEPTWPIHRAFFEAARLQYRAYGTFDVPTQTLRFDSMLQAVENAASGDLFLVHGCCQNPTGEDLSAAQWQELAGALARRGVVPLIDLAYQGFGSGLAADRAGAAIVLRNVPEAFVAYSCDKNFALYRERTGALYVLAADAPNAVVVRSNLQSLARGNWSMPPDCGAAIVAEILGSAGLAAQWRTELDAMRGRLQDVRRRIGAHGRIGAVDCAALARQQGMFSLLALTVEQVRELREKHAIYMTDAGRINVAGLTGRTVEPFIAALRAVC